LERRARLDADETTGWHVDPLWRLAYVQRESAAEDDKRLLLNRVAVAASLRAGLVTPDIPAPMRESSAVAQLGHVPRWLARLVGSGEPLELVRTDDRIGHGASLWTVAWASVRE
jgi:hypothetical protein